MHLARQPRAPRLLHPLVPLLLIAAIGLPRAARSAPTLGFVENWPGISTQGWDGSFDMTFTNPGTGGLGGDGDGYLLLTKPPPKGHFGTRSLEAEYTGNWPAAGINLVRFWLNDVNSADPLEVHLAIGQFDNLWQYTQGFLAPLHRWGEATVNLNDSTRFTHIIAISGKGFQFALQNVSVIHIRHDRAPYVQLPDSIAGDLGIDGLTLDVATGGVGDRYHGAVHPVDLSPPYPNPSRGAVALSVQNRDGGEVRFQIVDLQGRVVRSSVLASASPGPGLWVWDGRDDQGKGVPPGAYRVRAIGPSGGTSRPLIRIE